MTEPEPGEPRIDVVIVNWNTGDCLRSCLASVARSKGVDVRSVVVIDNASVDGSALGLSGVNLHVVHNARNRGFAAACNQGAALGSSPLLLFLNPDTVLEPGTLDRAGQALLAPRPPGDPPRGICGGNLMTTDGVPGISASRFPTFGNVVASLVPGASRLPGVRGRHLSPDELLTSRLVDQVIGAFFLIRRDLFESLGGFDERFFVYYEEVDLSRRARDLGWATFFAHDARLQHVENVSAKASGGRALGYSLCSRTTYAGLHWPRWQRRALVLLTLLVELPLRMLRAVLTSPRATREVARAALIYLRCVRSGGFA
jgi:N-acetylglucosaminyl-diphospho-decaprenol L-rhamnosyltransferase